MKVDYERLVRASKQISIKGICNSDVRREMVEDTIAAIQADPIKAMATRYFGVKVYAGFGDQRCDCERGMGPRHGSIVFSISRLSEFKGSIAEDAIYAIECVRDGGELVTKSLVYPYYHIHENVLDIAMKIKSLRDEATDLYKWLQTQDVESMVSTPRIQ